MSLLLDALKKAAEEKQKRQASEDIDKEDGTLKKNKEDSLDVPPEIKDDDVFEFPSAPINIEPEPEPEPEPELADEQKEIEGFASTLEGEGDKKQLDSSDANSELSLDVERLNLEEPLSPQNTDKEQGLDLLEIEGAKETIATIEESNLDDDFDFDALSNDLSTFVVEDEISISEDEASVKEDNLSLEKPPIEVQNQQEQVSKSSEEEVREDSASWNEKSADQAQNIFSSKNYLQQKATKQGRIKLASFSLLASVVIIATYYLFVVKNHSINDLILLTENSLIKNDVLPNPIKDPRSIEKKVLESAELKKEFVTVLPEEVEILVEKKQEIIKVQTTQLKENEAPIIIQKKQVKHKTLPEKQLTFIKTKPKSHVHAKLLIAYRYYQQGSYQSALKIYKDVYQQDNENKDALLGLAAIAVNNGDKDNALRFYRKLKALYPEDMAINSSINNIKNQTKDGVIANYSKLKKLIESDPNSAYLHFNMGNTLSENKRWSEAQKYYFNAYRLSPNNADYLYNLAISLDYLSKHKAAIKFYELALKASEERSANFNERSVISRLSVLQKSLLAFEGN